MISFSNTPNLSMGLEPIPLFSKKKAGLIKSQVRCQLSYGLKKEQRGTFFQRRCKYKIIFFKIQNPGCFFPKKIWRFYK